MKLALLLTVVALGVSVVMYANHGDRVRTQHLLRSCNRHGGIMHSTYDGSLLVGVLCRDGTGESR
jgi:hypothetical protein